MRTKKTRKSQSRDLSFFEKIMDNMSKKFGLLGAPDADGQIHADADLNHLLYAKFYMNNAWGELTQDVILAIDTVSTNYAVNTKECPVAMCPDGQAASHTNTDLYMMNPPSGGNYVSSTNNNDLTGVEAFADTTYTYGPGIKYTTTGKVVTDKVCMAQSINTCS